MRTIIVDDEPLARKGIKKLLEKEQKIDIISECQNGEEAIIAINELEPDLVFLDIQMPEFNGFEVLKHLDLSSPPAIVFITAYDKYAVEAFEVNALDYLLKPFTDSRFKTALDRILDYINNKKLNELNRKIVSLVNHHSNAETQKTGQEEKSETVKSVKKYLSRIMIKEKGRISFVNVDEIKWLEALDYYVRIHTASSTYLLRQSLKQLEKSLDPEKFFRIHRSAIVKFEEIKTLNTIPCGDYEVILKDKTKLKLSRSRVHQLKEFLI